MASGLLMHIDDFTMFAEGLDHPECVTRGPDGLTYAGGEAGQVYRLGADDADKPEQIATTNGFLLGLCLDADRNIYCCDIKHNAVMRCFSSGGVSTYSSGSPQRPMVNPNYPVFDAAGNLYVTSSGHWKQHDGCVFRVRPGGGETTVVSTAASKFPNGCALSPDGRWLYVVLSLMPGVVRLAIDGGGEGMLGEPERVVELPGTVPDGVAFDVKGNLFVSCYTPDVIYKLAPTGHLAVLAQDDLRVTFASPTNIAFCGDDRRTLVVANLARWHLSRATMPDPGLPLRYPQMR